MGDVLFWRIRSTSTVVLAASGAPAADGYDLLRKEDRQLTIPRQLRDALGLAPGARLQASIDRNGRLVLVPPSTSLRIYPGTAPR